MYTLDVEFRGGCILQDFGQCETDPVSMAKEALKDHQVISVAVRDADTRKLVRFVDWRDMDEVTDG